MSERLEAVIIGAGHAGLSTSYLLTQQGRAHVVLDQGRIGESWRSRRWDSFTLVTPNWMLNLPGFPYQGPEPDAFLPRAQVVEYLEAYAASFGAPTREGVRVLAVEAGPDGSVYRVRTESHGDLMAPVVVVANGFFELPKIPPTASRIAGDLTQIASSSYKNPEQLPPGAVLVVGSGQSGCQIAEELHESGRNVYLATGTAGRLPRRYRGKDTMAWAKLSGMLERTPEQLPSPKAVLAGNPHCSGKRGGHTLNLHHLCSEGMILLGHFQDVSGKGDLLFAPDLKANLEAADKFAAELKNGVDEADAKGGLGLPPADPADDYEGQEGYQQAEILQLDPRVEGITSVVWANGFTWDYGMVKLPVLDERGLPVHQRGVTAAPGLYFMGVHFQHKQKSDLFCGVGEDAAHVAEHIAAFLGAPHPLAL